MGAGILPTTIINNKLYFLFGKENKYDKTPGFSDIGGSTDNNETFMETATREATEELCGFLGMENDIKALLTKYGTYNIQWASQGHADYRMFVFPIEYDPNLVYYYNNNHTFIERKLEPTFIKNSRIFEKAELRWFCIDEIMKKQKQFRSYFQHVVKLIYEQRKEIELFIRKSKVGVKQQEKRKSKKTRKNLKM